MKHFDRVWAEVDLDAVAYNVESIKNSIKEDTKIIADTNATFKSFFMT